MNRYELKHYRALPQMRSGQMIDRCLFDAPGDPEAIVFGQRWRADVFEAGRDTIRLWEVSDCRYLWGKGWEDC
jgi:hypothetical protein